MPKVLATMTFWYETDETYGTYGTDGMDIGDQIQTDVDEIRKMVEKYGTDIRVKMHDVDIEVEIA